MTAPRYLVLGAGYAGSAVARLARRLGRDVTVTVRSDARAESLMADGFDVVQSPALGAEVAKYVDESTDVLVAFQPDPATDAVIAPIVGRARSVVYVSSTGVYGDVTGHVDDDTLMPHVPDARARKILDAEQLYRSAGATVLRCPGIYGPDRGLHMRILKGDHKIPGTGESFLSRIHVADLASYALAAAGVRQETFVVGDAEPAPHIEVVRFVCTAYGIPMPEQVPLDSVHASLRANRRIDATRARAVLGVTLRYPSYREGMAPDATGIAPRIP